MDWFAPVDIYCERLGPGFWAEPANALTNAAFLLAALWGGVEARRRGLTTPVLWLLIGLAGAIGLGSFLFHTYANRWSELADTLPIWTFVAVYVLAAMRYLGGMRPGRIAVVTVAVAALLTLVFLATGEGGGPDTPPAPPAPDPLNGSGQYAPALLALLGFSILAGLRRHPYRRWVWGATGAFVMSLTFRTLDRDVCAAFPPGTHFLWHLMNAAMIAALLQLLVRMIDDLREAR